MKIPNKGELQQIASNHSSGIEFKDLIKLYKDNTKEPFSFLLNHTTLSLNNPLTFRKNLSIRRLLLRKSKQSITKSSKTELNTILTDKLLILRLHHQEMLVNINF